MQVFDDPRRLRLSGMAAAGADVQLPSCGC